ncbi:MAG: MFS transporter [Thermoproteota archaeon]
MQVKQKIITPLRGICLGSFFITSASQVVSPILSLYATETLGASVIDVGTIISAFSIASSITRFPLALLASRGKGKTILLASYASLCPIFLAQGLVTNVLHLILLRIVGGFFFAIIGPFSLALSTFSVPSGSRDSAVAMYTGYVAMGLMAGPAVGTISVTFFGARSTFFIASSLSMLGFMFVLIGARDIEMKGGERPSSLSSIKDAISNRFFIMCFLAIFCFSFQVTVVSAYAPLYARQNFGMDDATVSAIFFAYSIFLVLTRLSIKHLSTRIRRRTLLSLGLANSAMMILFISFSPSVVLFFICYSLLGFSHGIVPPSAALIVAGSVEPSELVVANSIYFNSWDLGAMIGPFVTASMAESLGFAQALNVTSILSIIGILEIFVLSGSKWKEIFAQKPASNSKKVRYCLLHYLDDVSTLRFPSPLDSFQKILFRSSNQSLQQQMSTLMESLKYILLPTRPGIGEEPWKS